jgi:PAS domain S-box-containing protein
MTIAGNMVNIILGLSPWLIGLTALGSCVVFFYFMKARTARDYEKYIYHFIVISTSILSVGWIMNGGIDSNMTSLFFVYFVAVFTIIPTRHKFIVFLVYATNFVILIGVNYYYPSLITPYQTKEQRFVDMISGNLVYLLILYNLLAIMVKNYSFEQQKVKTRSAAITRLNNELQEQYKKIEEINRQLQESELSYSSIVKYSPNVNLIHDGVKILYINEMGEKLSGYSASELIGKPLNFFLSSSSFNLVHENIQRRMNGEPVEQYEVAIRAKNGTEYIFTVSATSIYYQGKPQMLVVLSDITDRKRAEEEIQRYSLELKEANATKDRFISILSHDLRSPFYGLIGLSEVLKNEAHSLTPDEIKNFSSKLHEAITLQYDLLNDLLTWSQIHSNKLGVKPELLYIAKTVADINKLFWEQTEKKRIRLNNTIPDSVCIMADKSMVNMIFRNLIHNAIKFSFPDSVIHVSYRQQSNGDCFLVQDSGVGMTQEDIEQVFKIDTTFTSLGTNNEKGSGMGLVLCQEIMVRHSGTISVESTPNQGTTFTLFFPRSTTSAAD